MEHIVYCDEDELTKILNGKKTMIVRGSNTRKIPHSRVFIDDVLFFIQKGTDKIIAKAIVKNVENYVKLSIEDIDKVLEENSYKLNLSSNQIMKSKKPCLCIVEFKDVENITPIDYTSKRAMDDWIIVTKVCDE